MTVYSLKTLRTLALHTQRLANSQPPAPTADAIYQVVEDIGCVQIDTLQMVHRSQYLAIWSRLGTYNTHDFDDLIFDPTQRRLFEYWLHAACIIPLNQYRYRIPTMQTFGERNGVQRWLAQQDHAELMKQVYARIEQEGALRSSDFDYKGPKRDSWWDWKPAKRALEILFDQGDLMISNRIKFQRSYDLRERVLPAWVDTTAPTLEETRCRLLEQSARALGVAAPNQIPNYTHMPITPARPIVQELVNEGILHEIKGELSNGSTTTLLVHCDNLPVLQQAADGVITAERTTFLSPFDSLFWANKRDQQLWNFRQTLEAYKPAPIREWGYFCLPILHKDRLIGRFDPKLERRAGILRLKALHLEPDIDLTDEMVADISIAMQDFMRFHKAKELVIEQSNPPAFAKRLLQQMTSIEA
ncbi:MAG: YcaQ family DNA glycosylase [Anaerolineales bacterium]|nr:YcaQ family DNA glycosylase [Anaerolineales bacterium]